MIKNKDKYAEKMTAKDMAETYLGSRKKHKQVYDAKRTQEKILKKLFG